VSFDNEDVAVAFSFISVNSLSGGKVSEVGEWGEKEGGRGKKEGREGGVVSRASLESAP